MTASPAQPAYQEAQVRYLEGVRGEYVRKGYDFVIEPGPDRLPDFMGPYRPDAVALKPGENIAIEVKRRPGTARERRLQDIRRLFEGHPDWRFVVAFMGTEPLQGLSIPPATPEAIGNRRDEIIGLLRQGDRRAAFVMAWSLLEAAVHRIARESGNRPLTPGTALQTLAMLGHVEPELETRLRRLIPVRNRIVHGDLTAEPTDQDVELVLSVTSGTLDAPIV